MTVPTDPLPVRDLKVLWHPCAQMRDYRDFPPMHVVSAKGSRLRLADGRELIDAISSWWCKSLGHGHPRLRRALNAQARQFEHVILANTTNEPVVRLCERLLAIANDRATPAAAFGKVFLADNGSTGIEIALKLALHTQVHRGQSRRIRFAHFENGYHGETLATLAVGDCGLYGEPYRPLFFPTVRLTGLPYRSGPDDPRWLDAGAEWPGIARQLDAAADELAAVVYEPVLQGAGGMKLYSPDLLPRLRRWAEAHGVLLIADEIAAGFGRCESMLASHLGYDGRSMKEARPTSEQPSPLPHLAVVSKGLTGGFLPLSAVLIPDAIYDLFDADYTEHKAFMHSNTYTGNALAVAVANAALDVFAQDNILGRIARHGPKLRRGLLKLARTRPGLHNVRGVGFMAAVDIRQPDGTAYDARLRTGYRVYQEAVCRGALLRPIGDTMYLFPPFTTPTRDITAMLDILGQSLDAVLGAG